MSTLKGLAAVRSRLVGKIAKIKGRMDRSLIAAGQFIQAESQRRTPVDTGNLKGGARTTWVTTIDQGTKVVVSYQASYSVSVHEIPMYHEVGTWKFLENAVTENWDRILSKIKEDVHIS